MKPELLLPVGNTEAFYAALEGGADAVYLGLRSFNARGRAQNFAPNQLQSLLKESQRSGLKVYLTLNTLIKNSELPTLLDMLYMLSQTTVSSLIIQDLGVYYLLNKFFNKLPIHASTQMGIHNSTGTNYLHSKSFERVILARELTLPELTEISRKAKIELEIFAHGALCYSFSGMCLFSSYLGGMSANRGLCCQPCRRIFNSSQNSDYFFSLKDNQLIELLPQIMKLNISGIKIEGRMKAAEYVYNVARAYRMVIDDPTKIETAKEILKYDFGREKTSYFLGGNIENAITEDPYIGIYIGKVSSSDEHSFSFKTLHRLKIMDRLRILPKSGTDARAIKIKEFKKEKGERKKENGLLGEVVTIQTDKIKVNEGDKVFLIGLADIKFKSKFTLEGKRLKLHMPEDKTKNILNKIGSSKILSRQQLFIRINSFDWLRKLYFDKFDFLILNLSKKEWEKLNLHSPFLKKNSRKLIIQLPKFISESDIDFYRSICSHFFRAGVSSFMLSHISQKLILPDSHKITLCASENVYALNDVAIQFLKEEFIKFYVYPFENDHQNLSYGKDRKGIVPLYFHPELFHSRMPVLFNHKDTPIQSDLPAGQVKTPSFRDDRYTYKKLVRDGITIVIPEVPVSLLQFKDKLVKEGFRRFLIDLSCVKSSQNMFNRLLKKFHTSTAEQPGTSFNFKAGLK
ncbi:MAG: U32 family peptidase [Candidatus Cloacimonetes bacterium]|nr:U32 family peptidase [Candidatus Cloacimonadota bacterium]